MQSLNLRREVKPKAIETLMYGNVTENLIYCVHNVICFGKIISR